MDLKRWIPWLWCMTGYKSSRISPGFWEGWDFCISGGFSIPIWAVEPTLNGDVGDLMMVTQNLLVDGQEELASHLGGTFLGSRIPTMLRNNQTLGIWSCSGKNKPKIWEFRLRHRIFLEPFFMEDLEVASCSKEYFYGPVTPWGMGQPSLPRESLAIGHWEAGMARAGLGFGNIFAMGMPAGNSSASQHHFSFPSWFFPSLPQHFPRILFVTGKISDVWILGLSGVSKRIHKLSLGLIFTYSLLHVGVKTDKTCLTLFSVIFPTPLAFIKLIYLFFPPFPLSLKWLLPHPQHWLTKHIWKVK